jgi:hypothetical protein
VRLDSTRQALEGNEANFAKILRAIFRGDLKH